MSTVRRTIQARSDLIGIGLYIGADNPSAADHFLDVLEAKLHLLAAHPELGQPRPELATCLRSFVVRNYVLFYRPMKDGIELIRVLHSAREIDAMF